MLLFFNKNLMKNNRKNTIISYLPKWQLLVFTMRCPRLVV